MGLGCLIRIVSPGHYGIGEGAQIKMSCNRHLGFLLYL